MWEPGGRACTARSPFHFSQNSQHLLQKCGQYAHHEVQVRGYVGEIVIGAGSEVTARYPRSYEKVNMVLDPPHFLPLLEQKVGALDQAAPFQGWDLPREFVTLRWLLEARMGKPGKRE